MIESFTPEAKIVHFHGNLSGESDIRHFLSDHYPYLVPGVGRCACHLALLANARSSSQDREWLEDR